MNARPRVLISYRRADTAGYAGRLYDRLAEHFGDENVFMDLAGIGAGEDFVAAIEREVAGADSVIVLIGREWVTTTDDRGRRRLEDPEDFVHLEVQSALQRDVHVIPVLVEGAAMPSAADLPPGLAGLARRNAQELSDGRWRFDTDTLIAAIEQRAIERGAVAAPPPPPPPDPARAAAPGRRRGLVAAVVGVVAVAVLVVAGVLLLRGGDGDAADAASADSADEFVVTPGSIVFATQQVGSASDAASVEVKNTGPEPFTLRVIRVLPGGSFLLDDKDCLARALGPKNQSCELRLRFLPTTEGPYEAQLLIREQLNSVTRRVALTGDAVDVPDAPPRTDETPTETPLETTGTAPVIPVDELPESFDPAPTDEAAPAPTQ